MHKQEILDRVLRFCDVRGDTFHWRQEPARSQLFQIFQDSLAETSVTADEIHEHIRQHMEPMARWHVPMQERVADVCTAWEDWDYAVQNAIGLFAGAE
ncbi:MAG TPA: hypothetical protein VGG64_27040 [Pirellulales bacterium]|jgi:hypothetical protein